MGSSFETSNREGIAKNLYSLEDLQPHFGSKREDAAKCLGVSVSTFKRICRQNGIHRWPNRIRNRVPRHPDRHGENNPSPTCKTLSTDGQAEMENEMVGHFQEPDEFLPDSIEGPSCCNVENGSIVETVKTPIVLDYCPGNYPDMGFRMSFNYKESEEAGASSEWAFQQNDQTTMYQNSNNLLAPLPHIPTKMVIDNMEGLDCETLFDSVEVPFQDENVSGSRNLMVPMCIDPAPNEPLASIPNTMPTIPCMMPPPIELHDSTKVKAMYGDITIKFQFARTSGVIELKGEVSKRLKFELDSFDLVYKDEDGDQILIACDEDVHDYLSSLDKQLIKLLVLEKVANPRTFVKAADH